MSEGVSVFDKIKNASDIVAEVSVFIDLVKKGRNYWGICPFHDDTSPSMSVSPEKQLFKCFVCQVGGNVISFVSNYEKVSFVEAAKKLADKTGITFNTKNNKEREYSDSEKNILNALQESMNFFQYSLNTEDGEKALKYLRDRDIDMNDIENFSIGYAPNDGLISFLKNKEIDESIMINSSLATEKLTDFFRDRIIFGIKNNEGQIAGFSARTINGDETSKYINSSSTKLFDKKKILYNYSNAIGSINKNKEVIISEGFMDVIALSKADIFNAVAIMGTALTPEHVNLLGKKTIILMLDSDKAGILATIKSIQKLLPHNNDVFIVQNETNLDPDEFFKKHGKKALQELTQKRIHSIEFIYNEYKKNIGVSSPEKLDKFIKSFTPYLKFANTTFQDFFIKKINDELGVEKDTLRPMLQIEKKGNEAKSDNKTLLYEESRKLVSNKTINENKWANKLISAMVNKPALIPIYDKNHVNFLDPMLQSVAEYIVKLKKGIPQEVNPNIKDMLIGIQNYSKNDKKLEESEFLDLIERVNKVHRKKTLLKLKNKIENDDVNKTKMLENMTKLIKERK